MYVYTYIHEAQREEGFLRRYGKNKNMKHKNKNKKIKIKTKIQKL